MCLRSVPPIIARRGGARKEPDAEPPGRTRDLVIDLSPWSVRDRRGAKLATVRIAVCTVSLPEWTPEQAVTEVAALGFDGIEWRVADDPPTDSPPGFWRGNRCTLPASSFEQ